MYVCMHACIVILCNTNARAYVNASANSISNAKATAKTTRGNVT